MHLVGDVMVDALWGHGLARQRSRSSRQAGAAAPGYLLATVHRPYNTDVPENLRNILAAFEDIAAQRAPVVVPLHPRTRKIAGLLNLPSSPSSG